MTPTGAFLLNVLLALGWTAMTARLTPGDLAVGFVLGFLLLWFAEHVRGPARYVAKMRQVVSFAAFFAWELVLASLRVAYDVVTPREHMRPGVIGVRLDARSDAEITWLANLITLTPGTLSLDVSDDHKVLYIHTAFMDDRDAVERDIKERLERRLLEVMR